MQRWRSREELVAQVVDLRRQGVKQRAIARALGISRNTVKKILFGNDQQRSEGHQALRPAPRRAPRQTKLDEHRAKVGELLERYPQITAQRVFEELVQAGYEGGYGPVKRYVRRIRPPERPRPSLETPQHGPGKMAESDWTPCPIEFTTGRRAVVQVFDYVYVFSRRKSYGLYERCDFYALMDGHVTTFERVGGAAEVCKYDTQKAVVLGWEGAQPIYNPRFLAFSTYYDFQPLACRRFHPNDKPRAERSFWEFEQSFLNGRSFRDLDDMRLQLAQWQRTTCDQRPHKHDKSTPLSRFVEEQPHLRPLPQHPYDTARVVYRLCSLEGFIAWDGNLYAAPYDQVTDILPVRISQHELFIYAADLRLLARHELAPHSAGAKLDPQGFHRRSPKTPAIDLDQLRRVFEDLGEQGPSFFVRLCTVLGRLAGHHARQILLLRERYSSADIDAALRHAQQYGAYDYHAIERILAARAAPRRLAEYVTEELEQRLGPDPTAPRDLDEYDRLPLASSVAKEPACPSETNPQEPTSSSSDCDDTSTCSACATPPTSSKST